MSTAPPTTVPISIANELRGIVVTGLNTSAGRNRRLPDETSWRNFLPSIVNDPSSLTGYELLKYSGGNEVFRATLTWTSGETPASLNVVCKKTVQPQGLKGFADSLRAPRARKNFDRGLLLRSVGIATPLPLAAIARTRLRANWLVTEFLPDLLDLDRIALVDLPQLPRCKLRATKNALITATSDLFSRLYRNSLFHRDLKASNILIDGWQRGDGTPRTTLVDLDGLGKGARSETGRWKPLVRLAASLLDYPGLTRGDFARLLQTYLADTGDDPSAWRRHFRRLSQAAIRYAEKSRSRKSHKLDGYV